MEFMQYIQIFGFFRFFRVFGFFRFFGFFKFIRLLRLLKLLRFLKFYRFIIEKLYLKLKWAWLILLTKLKSNFEVEQPPRIFFFDATIGKTETTTTP